MSFCRYYYDLGPHAVISLPNPSGPPTIKNARDFLTEQAESAHGVYEDDPDSTGWVRVIRCADATAEVLWKSSPAQVYLVGRRLS